MKSLDDLQNQLNRFRENFGKDPEKIEMTLWQLKKFESLICESMINDQSGMRSYQFDGIPLVLGNTPKSLIVM